MQDDNMIIRTVFRNSFRRGIAMARGYETILKLFRMDNNKILVIPGEIDFVVTSSAWVKLASKSPTESIRTEETITREGFTHASFLYTSPLRGQFNRRLVDNMHSGCHTCLAGYPFWIREKESYDYRPILQIGARQTTGPLRELRPIEDHIPPLAAQIRAAIDPYLPLDMSLRNLSTSGQLGRIIQRERERTRINDIRARQLDDAVTFRAPLQDMRMAPYPRRIRPQNGNGSQMIRAQPDRLDNTVITATNTFNGAQTTIQAQISPSTNINTQ